MQNPWESLCEQEPFVLEIAKTAALIIKTKICPMTKSLVIFSTNGIFDTQLTIIPVINKNIDNPATIE